MAADEPEKVVIVGSGPAGYTAALYTARANLSPVLFEGSQPGGQLTITTDVENYPGFPEGILGPEMMRLFKSQAERFGTRVRGEMVTGVELREGSPFSVTAASGEELRARALIIATGASARLLGLPDEDAYMGHGLSACATCDGFFFRDKEVLVVGGGDSAMEEATFLTRFCKRVTVTHRRDTLRASKIMQDRARSNEKIDFMWDTEVESYLGTPGERLEGVRLRNSRTGEVWEQPTGGVFLAIGHVPNSQLFAGQLDMDDKGYIITKPDRTATSREGVFASGDIQDSYYRQAVTAAGTGCAAAIEAERWLETMGG